MELEQARKRAEELRVITTASPLPCIVVLKRRKVMW